MGPAEVRKLRIHASPAIWRLTEDDAIESHTAHRTVFTGDELVRQLRNLGLRAGDVVLTRVDFGKLGRVQRPGDVTLIESLMEVVGGRGTLVALTHSPVQWIFRKDRSYVYEPATAPTVVGRFAEAILHSPGVYRSLHPTCSMAAIGANAVELLRNHDHTATAFMPVQSLLARRGKLLLIGCTLSSPGFSTVHHAYEQLNLATRSLLSGMIGCYFRHESRTRWFRQRDIPGCSLGFHKFYPLYRAKNLLREGKVGAADAFLIDANDAFAVELEAIRRQPTFSLCDDPCCFSCRGTKLFNPGDMLRYFLTQFPRKVLSRRR